MWERAPLPTSNVIIRFAGFAPNSRKISNLSYFLITLGEPPLLFKISNFVSEFVILLGVKP